MAYEYKGRYYATLASQRAAILQDEYKDKPAVLETFKSVATTAAPRTARGTVDKAAVDLKTWDLVKGFEQAAAAPQQAAPAPARAPARAAAPATPSADILKITKEAEDYRKEAEAAIAAGKERIAQLEDEELQRQKATELQNRLAIQSAASKARGQMGAQLKIAPASQTARTAGTAAFKRRSDRMRLAPIQTTAGINVPSGSILNV